ncbi:MAG: acyl-CoA dehydratase activase-related protein [Butyricicoccus sp.]
MAQDEYYIDVRIEGQRAIRYADEHGLDVAVIAGRPYHVDPEINHGIDQLIASFGLVIVSEDAVWQLTDAPEVHVLNQWTYHSRMYGAAKYVTQKENAQLIQLVSFGCGIDAITTTRCAPSAKIGKIYTQLKIDEISNLVRQNPYPQHAGRRRGGTQACRTAKRLRQRPHIPTRSSRRKCEKPIRFWYRTCCPCSLDSSAA